MKFTCTQENLSRGLSIVSHIANKTATLPILSTVLIRATGNTITLTSTNLEMGVSCAVRGKVEIEGAIAVPARVLTEYVQLSAGNMDLHLEGDTLYITNGAASTKIKGFSPEEYPVIPHIKKQHPFIIHTHDAATAIGQVVFAVATTDTRPEISGVYVVFNESSVTLAATDSYRLAERTIPATNPTGAQKEIIIPAKTITELLRIISSIGNEDEEGMSANVELYFEDNQIMCSYNGVDLVSRIIEGQYPNYKQIIPTQHKTKAIMATDEAIRTVKAAALFSRTGIHDISLELKKGSCRVFTANAQVGEYAAEIQSEVEGEMNTTNLNYKYFIDGFSHCESDRVEILITDSSTAVVMRPAEGQGTYTYLIMPIKQ